MAKMKAVQVSKANGPFEVVERDIPEPGDREVRIKIEACGMCHSDLFVRSGAYPGLKLPRIPGHEIAGRIDKVGAKITAWKVGDRVGVGWHGGHCFECNACRKGVFINCAKAKVTGISHDGGYAEYAVVPTESVARIPEGLDPIETGPLLCAGVTTFNALRHCGARPGELVAIHGVGGLGHLGIQFAARLGFRVAAVNRGRDKQELARSLGAHEYIDSSAGDPAAALRSLGGARAILATVTDAAAMQAIVGGLGVNGTLMVIGAVGALTVDSLDLLRKRASVRGWYSGIGTDSEDTLMFSHGHGITSMNEVYPLEQAQAAYERMLSGRARFRVVLKVE
jgi:alcohol dehydrogenase